MTARVLQPPPENFIDTLAAHLYQQPNIDRATHYLNQRLLQQPPVPWVATDAERSYWRWAEPYYHTFLLTEALFIPIVDIRDPSNRTLAGFDIRYIGSDPKRSRFIKIKRAIDSQFVYGVYREPTGPVVVTESAIDAETFLQIGVSSVSPCTAFSAVRWMAFLLAWCPGRILLAYDNDHSGWRATKQMQEHAKMLPAGVERVGVLTYRSKDPNDALRMLGAEYLRATVGGFG